MCDMVLILGKLASPQWTMRARRSILGRFLGYRKTVVMPTAPGCGGGETEGI